MEEAWAPAPDDGVAEFIIMLGRDVSRSIAGLGILST